MINVRKAAFDGILALFDCTREDVHGNDANYVVYSMDGATIGYATHHLARGTTYTLFGPAEAALKARRGVDNREVNV